MTDSSKVGFFNCTLKAPITGTDSSEAEFSDCNVHAMVHIQSNSSVVLKNNIFFVEDGMVLLESSRIHILGAFVVINKTFAYTDYSTYFLDSQSYSFIDIFNSTIQSNCYTSSLTATNTSLSITSSNLYFSFSKPLPVDEGLVVFLRIIESNFTILNSKMSGVQQTADFNSLWGPYGETVPSPLRFHLSNGTIDNSHFTNCVLYFGPDVQLKDVFRSDSSGRMCHITIKNTVCDRQDPDQCLALFTQQEMYDLALDNSVLRLFPTIPLESEDCFPWDWKNDIVPKESLHLYNSTLFIHGSPQNDTWDYLFKFMMSSLVTWNSIFANGQKAIHSEDPDFLVKMKSLGLFWVCSGDEDKFRTNASLIADPSAPWISFEPNFLNTMFASGKIF